MIINYWNWLLHAWKKPGDYVHGKSWYGILTLFIENILVLMGLAIGLTSIVNNYYNIKDMNSTMNMMYSSSVLRIHSLLFYVMLYLCFADFLIIGAAFLGYRYSHNIEIKFSNYVNRVAQYSSYNLFISLVLFLSFLGLGSLTLLVAVCLCLSILLLIVSANAPILMDSVGVVQDRLIGTIFSTTAAALVIVLTVGLVFSTAYSQMWGFISQILNSLFG